MYSTESHLQSVPTITMALLHSPAGSSDTRSAESAAQRSGAGGTAEEEEGSQGEGRAVGGGRGGT